MISHWCVLSWPVFSMSFLPEFDCEFGGFPILLYFWSSVDDMPMTGGLVGFV